MRAAADEQGGWLVETRARIDLEVCWTGGRCCRWFEQAAAVGAAGRAPGRRLVGREDELALLTRRWSRALEGEGQFVQIVGEPGIGQVASDRGVPRKTRRVG